MNKSNRPFVVKLLVLLTIIVYLFVSAEPPLPDGTQAERPVPIAEALTLISAENDAVRALYTKEIVGKGIKIGLAFGEDWKERGVEKGPLPALFLRETSMYLEKSPVRLGLFLGSEFPISSSNQFQGTQMTHFEGVKAKGEPAFFFEPDTKLYTAMFADRASAEACVTCHNQHPETPKTDWALGDIMGATTWTHPDEYLAYGELVELIKAYRTGVRNTYKAYLEKAATFADPPEIGERWPRDGRYLPSLEVFMEEVSSRISPRTLNALLKPVEAANEAP